MKLEDFTRLRRLASAMFVDAGEVVGYFEAGDPLKVEEIVDMCAKLSVVLARANVVRKELAEELKKKGVEISEYLDEG